MEKELERFIKEAVENSISKKEILQSLKQSGWEDSDIKEAINKIEILQFVKEAKKANLSKKEIKESLIKSGWSEAEVNPIIGKWYSDLHFRISGNFVLNTLKFILLIAIIALVLFAGYFVFNNLDSFGSLFNTGTGIIPNQTAFIQALNNYQKNSNLNCGHGSAVISGMIIGDSQDFSDTKISSNVGNLVVNNLDALGNYKVTINCINESVISFQKTGFVPLHKKVYLSTGANDLDVLLTKEIPFETLSVDKDNSIEQDGVNITVFANSLVSLNGNISTSAKISVTRFDGTSIKDMDYFPGSLKGINLGGKFMDLASFGFFKIKVEDKNNKSLELKNESAIRIVMPIADSQKDSAPKVILVWNFNETLGTWIQVGGAIKNCISGVCFYEFNLSKISSYYSLNSEQDYSSFLYLDGFDISVANRVDSASSTGTTQNTQPKVTLNPGEKLVNLAKVKTNMVCKRDEISGYERIVPWGVTKDEVSEFLLSTTTITDYIGKGVSQVVQDEKGNTMKEIETNCTCRQTQSVYNRYLYDCDGYDSSGKYYDGCTQTNVEFSCAAANVTKPDCTCDEKERQLYAALAPYRQYILDASKEFGVAPELIASLALAEFNNMQQLNFNNAIKKTLTPDSQNPLIALGFGNMHPNYREETLALINAEDMSSNNQFSQAMGSTWALAEEEQLSSQPQFATISQQSAADLYPSSWGVSRDQRTFNPEGEVRLVAASIAAMVYLWDNDPNSGTTSLSDQPDILGTLYNAGWVDGSKKRFFNPKANPRPNDEKSYPVSFDCKDNGKLPFAQRVKMFANSERLKKFLKTGENPCGSNSNSDLKKDVEDLKSFNDWLQKAPTPTIGVGNAILDTNFKRDISLYDGVDLNSGKINFPINKFVHLEDVDLLNGNAEKSLSVYDSFVSFHNGDYYIGGPSGVYNILSNNRINFSEDKIIIEKDGEILEFGKKIGNKYLITKARSGDNIFIYNYSGSILHSIDGPNLTNVYFNYTGEVITNIIYHLSPVGGEDFIENFIYGPQSITRSVRDIQGNLILQENFSKSDVIFKLTGIKYEVDYHINNKKVSRIDINTFYINNTRSFSTSIAYAGDYTYLTGDNSTTICYQGICSIDKIIDSITTSIKYDPKQNYVPFKSDKLSLIISGSQGDGGQFYKEIYLHSNNITSRLVIPLPARADLLVHLTLNGVPSIPIKVKTPYFGKQLNLIDFIDPAVKCPSCIYKKVSFGGFSLDTCTINSANIDKLKTCISSAKNMFELDEDSINLFKSNLSLDANIKKYL